MVQVSVVVPVYNVERYLPRCVESLCAQTYADVQIILVDDGSTDASRHLCDEFALAHAQVSVVHRTNGGLSAARNTGLQEATGEYVMFLDSDDWIDSEGVARMLEVHQCHEADVLVAGFHTDEHDVDESLLDRKTTLPPLGVVRAGDPFPFELTHDIVNVTGYAWNKLYRREFLTGHKFLEGVSLVEDITFNGPLLAEADAIVYLDEAFVHYVQRPRLTLGTGHQPDLGGLINLATRSLRTLLKAWAIPTAKREAAIRSMEHGRLQWALRGIAIHGQLVGAERRLLMARTLKDPHVKRILESEARSAGRLRSILMRTQSQGFVWPTYLYYRIRRVMS